MSVPHELGSYLDELAARVARILGPRLVGVYAGGSVAFGAYRHGRSDVDVAAVSAARVSAARKQAIVDALRHEALPCPARGLEFVLYPLDVARSGTPEPGFELNLNTGERMALRVDVAPDPSEAHWFAIDRSILAGCGVAIVGPPAGTVFGRVPRDAVLTLLEQSLAWHEGGDSRADDAILNAARTLRFAREGVWSSKTAAGEWALSAVDDPQLVERALAATVADGPDPPHEDAARFVADVRRRLAEA
jgi:predicted nucleotidyltransferase